MPNTQDGQQLSHGEGLEMFELMTVRLPAMLCKNLVPVNPFYHSLITLVSLKLAKQLKTCFVPQINKAHYTESLLWAEVLTW